MNTEPKVGDVWGDPSDSSTWECVREIDDHTTHMIYTTTFSLMGEYDTRTRKEWDAWVASTGAVNITTLALKATSGG